MPYAVNKAPYQTAHSDLRATVSANISNKEVSLNVTHFACDAESVKIWLFSDDIFSL